MPPSAYTASRPRSRHYRLLHDRRPAEKRWFARQKLLEDQLGEDLRPLRIALSDGEGQWAKMCEQRLLLVVGEICLLNGRPDIWRQIYEAWDEMPRPDLTNPDLVLLAELTAKARRGEI